jgi:hypothetical protein
MSRLNRWTAWTAASEAVPYLKSGGTGPGEAKVAAELGASVLGQNSPYDMDAVVEGVMRKIEVKEPDAANSFTCGRNGRDALRPTKARIEELLLVCAELGESPLLVAGHQALVREVAAISPDEVCGRNIKKLTTVCTELNGFSTQVMRGLPTLPLYNPFTGKSQEVSALRYYETGRSWGMTEGALREKLGDAYASVQFVVRTLTVFYIQSPAKLEADLQGLRSIFSGYILVLVHPEKGYYLMENADSTIEFNRITRGHPRFRVAV